jgi:hypothetical protein
MILFAAMQLSLGSGALGPEAEADLVDLELGMAAVTNT